MNIRSITVGELETNCYIVWDNSRSHVLLIDPGAEADKIIETLESLDLIPTEIVLTHSHYDHIAAVPEIKKRYNPPVVIHKQDAANLNSPHANFSAIFGGKIAFSADRTINEGHRWKFDKGELAVLHTPGHSAGSISLSAAGIVISGDTIFKTGVGRTDLPGGDYPSLVKSIKRLLGFRDSAKIYPGHGPKTTIGDERLYLTGL